MTAISITADVDLHFSPDDDTASGKGWYFQDYSPSTLGLLTSQLFKTKADAMIAFGEDNILWGD